MAGTTLSVTDLVDADLCPRRFWFRKVQKRRTLPPGASVAVGTAAHAVLHDVAKGARDDKSLLDALAANAPDLERVARALDAAAWRALQPRLVELASDADAADLERLDRIVRDLARFLAALLVTARRHGATAREALDTALAATERSFTLSLGDGAPALSGRIDLLSRNAETGVTWVLDLKTWLPDDTRAVENQVRLYAAALALTGVADATPGLVCLSGDRAALHEFAAPATNAREHVESRLRRAALWITPDADPPPTEDRRNCVHCAVQSACWEKWGPTLPGAGRTSAAPGASPPPAGAHPGADDASRLRAVLTQMSFPPEECDAQNAVIGPRVILWRVRLAPSASLSRLQSRAADISREMEWPIAPIIQNVAGSRYVGIAAPRTEPEVVPFSQAFDRLASRTESIPIPVGVTLAREPRFLDLATAPHLLVAGTTRSGKSVFLRTLVLALLARSDAEIVLIDPKQLDFAAFRGAPRLDGPIVDMGLAVARLTSLVEEEMPRRTALLQRANAVDWLELRKRDVAAIRPTVVVIDEFADLMDSLAKSDRTNFELAIVRLAQRARAVGIQLVIATQRPTTDVVTGRLKANLPQRIAFRLPAVVDSQTILDEPGAERLLGEGDLLFRNPSGLERLQGYFAEGDWLSHQLAAMKANEGRSAS